MRRRSTENKIRSARVKNAAETAKREKLHVMVPIKMNAVKEQANGIEPETSG